MNDKIKRIMQGETVTVSDAEYNVLCETIDGIRSIRNPQQCGILDPWLAFITRYPSKQAE